MIIFIFRKSHMPCHSVTLVDMMTVLVRLGKQMKPAGVQFHSLVSIAGLLHRPRGFPAHALASSNRGTWSIQGGGRQSVLTVSVIRLPLIPL